MNVITNTIAIDVITVFTKCASFCVLIGAFRGMWERSLAPGTGEAVAAGAELGQIPDPFPVETLWAH